MKTRFASIALAVLEFLAVSLVALAINARAQLPPNDPLIPVVTLTAPDPEANESGNPGAFRLFRAGPTNLSLNVFWLINGSASNGVDYKSLPGLVSIPAGVREVRIPVLPIDDNLAEGPETVEAHLFYPSLGAPITYVIGSPSNAVVTIFDNDPPPTNLPPVVRLVSPPFGALFPAPANISICADARDADGYVNTVEFFAGTNSLGIKTNCLPCASIQNPFCLVWSNVPPGEYVLTAKATDNLGASTASDPVNVKVILPPPPNMPPVVQVSAPTNGAIFTAPVNIPFAAIASDPDDNVVRVEFFAGDHFIGGVNGTNLPVYSIVWSNALPGLYSLHARATDDRGAVGLSEPVRIAVTGTNLPPTNLPPIVTIFAPDPIAAEGTNSWRWCTNSTVGVADAIRLFGGTNTATFVVRRDGPTNDALTISYEIRGSASNGVDYVAIPHSVVIPAGERAARIVIVPIDDNLPECTETVVLRLTPDTNAPPPYIVGWPSRAAAVIVDNDSPPPGTRVLCDGTFHLRVPAAAGFNYRLECSADMIHWVTVGTNTVGELGVVFAEPDTLEVPTRFYRVVPQTSPLPP